MNNHEVRNDVASRFAESVGWKFQKRSQGACFYAPDCGLYIALPSARAPNRYHFVFLGEVAEVCGRELREASRVFNGLIPCGWKVVFANGPEYAAEASDLSMAAMLAVIKATDRACAPHV